MLVVLKTGDTIFGPIELLAVIERRYRKVVVQLLVHGSIGALLPILDLLFACVHVMVTLGLSVEGVFKRSWWYFLVKMAVWASSSFGDRLGLCGGPGMLSWALCFSFGSPRSGLWSGLHHGANHNAEANTSTPCKCCRVWMLFGLLAFLFFGVVLNRRAVVVLLWTSAGVL